MPEGVLLSDYKLFITNEYEKSFKKLDKAIQKKLTRKLENQVYKQLRNEPHFGKNIKKLRNFNPETWRYRIGNFRIFYLIDEEKKIIAFLSIDDRKNAY
jgi:mRNA interferase RelE/StbE